MEFGAEETYVWESLAAMSAARTAPGPEWLRDLYWQVASGLMCGEDAVRVLQERQGRECLP